MKRGAVIGAGPAGSAAAIALTSVRAAEVILLGAMRFAPTRCMKTLPTWACARA